MSDLTPRQPGPPGGSRRYADPAEDHLRAYFASLDSAAPTPAPAEWAARARTEVSGARRRTWLAMAACLAAVAVASAGGLWLRGAWPPADNRATAADGLLGDGPTEVLRLNGVEVTVPASMIPTDDCDPPTVAYVDNPIALRARCQATSEELAAGSVVVLRIAQPGDADEQRNALRDRDGRYTRTVYVATGGVVVSITSPSRRFIRQVAGTVHVDRPATDPSPDVSPADERSALEAWLESTRSPWRDGLTEVAGGRVFCGVTVVRSGHPTLADALPADRDLYVSAGCQQFYDEDGELGEGGGASGPFLMHVSGQGQFTTVISAFEPRQQSIEADTAALFPPKVADRLRRGVGAGEATVRIRARARAALAAGTLPPRTPGVGIRPSTVLGPVDLANASGYDGYVTIEPVLESVFVPLHRCDAPVGADDTLLRRFRAEDGTILGAQRVLRTEDSEAAGNVSTALTQLIDRCDQPTDGEAATVLDRQDLPLPAGVDGTAWRYLLDQPGRGREAAVVVVLHVDWYVTELVLNRAEADADLIRLDRAVEAALTRLDGS